MDKSRLAFYNEENATMQEILRKLKLHHMDDMPPNLRDIIQRFEIKNSAETNKVEVQNKTLKILISKYKALNEKLSQRTESLRSILQLSHQDVEKTLQLNNDDRQQLEAKIEKYESLLVKIEQMDPWLKDPNFDLLNMMAKQNTLNPYKEEKDNLLKELSVYKDLKPDINQAKQQILELFDELKSLETI
ncbi:uncharacterized protein [Euwallacea similis]|uniref:uncharacterized protein n=1 Tax=Euwallacea similis TaxID=1736056 RepID=UPI00344D9249